MRGHWKHVIGFAACGGSLFVVYVVAVALSFAGLSPDGPTTEHQRQMSSHGHVLEAIFLLPARWLFGESRASVFASWVAWSFLLYLLGYSLARLIYGTKKRVA